MGQAGRTCSHDLGGRCGVGWGRPLPGMPPTPSGGEHTARGIAQGNAPGCVVGIIVDGARFAGRVGGQVAARVRGREVLLE